jgi:hypothetical protein
MHPIARMYEDIRPTPDSEVMMLKAMVEPIMISERRIVKMRVMITALSGMSQSGCTFQSLVTLKRIA